MLILHHLYQLPRTINLTKVHRNLYFRENMDLELENFYVNAFLKAYASEFTKLLNFFILLPLIQQQNMFRKLYKITV